MFWVSFSSSLRMPKQNSTKMKFPSGLCHWKPLQAGYLFPLAARGRPWPPVAARSRLATRGRPRPWPTVGRGRPWPLVVARGRLWPPVAAQWSYWENRSEFQSDISAVTFGRTDIQIGANDAPFCNISHGHGLEGACFHGVFKSLGFHEFCLLQKLQSGITGVGFGRTEVSMTQF